eukprot:CAMPEP_0206239868 /NCGR_PEP_ID=MMETSP0047_2-20121206/15625_1 /ASSEMBLY_ACC=CAM_ASM_000192 /TAXON_ID=195065 /ORGANISM="Chroomonas mesostigmatica_cf, Strain CCMP1168" /LENGTH=154 /DNA_ID=CAMNT_0053664593 /DNA_START=1080 /DNA_END=1546 /DNA_ORIENTATION=+
MASSQYPTTLATRGTHAKLKSLSLSSGASQHPSTPSASPAAVPLSAGTPLVGWPQLAAGPEQPPGASAAAHPGSGEVRAGPTPCTGGPGPGPGPCSSLATCPEEEPGARVAAPQAAGAQAAQARPHGSWRVQVLQAVRAHELQGPAAGVCGQAV